MVVVGEGFMVVVGVGAAAGQGFPSIWETTNPMSGLMSSF